MLSKRRDAVHICEREKWKESSRTRAATCRDACCTEDSLIF